MLLVNSSNLQITCHAVLIIYKSYATCFPSGPEARGVVLIIDKLHWHIYSDDLQKICLAT
jgi:hypothetical protein